MAGGRTYYAVLELAPRATGATYNSIDFHQHDQYKGAIIVIEKTAGDASIDTVLQGYHHATGTWFDVANTNSIQIAAGSATATYYVMVYPGITGAEADGAVALDTNYVHVSGFLPDTFRMAATLASGASATFAITIYPLR